MAHLDRSYYVAYLSAAAHHIDRTEEPGRFQIVTERQTRLRDWQGTPIEATMDRLTPRRPTQEISTRWGPLPVATPETLAYDLATRPERAGGLAYAARIIAHLTLDPAALARQVLARTQAAARRLGWILDHCAKDDPAAALQNQLRDLPSKPVLVDPDSPRSGPIDPTWRVRVNCSLT